LEVGRIEAAGKTLSEVRSEVRNILILNGLSPRFQLEISRFASQKAFLTINARSSVITLTDQVANLRDVLANAGKGVQTGVTTRVTLKRDGQEYTMRLRDIVALDAQAVKIKADDDIIVTDRTSAASTTRAIVGSDGSIVLPSIGKVAAAGKTLDELRTEVIAILEGTPNLNEAIQLDVIDFKSQSALLNVVGRPGAVIPITSKPQLLKEALTQSGVTLDPEKVVRISLKRAGETFRFNFRDLLNTQSPQTYVYAGDQITVDVLPYKPNKVFVLGGISPTIVPIDPKIRETLADILFTPNGVLSSPTAKRSEVYLLRGSAPIRAYHLDAQNPTRLVVADAMELRPNDILYVAEQPIVSFNRTLASIAPLRILLRDIQDDNIP
jgi:protein involved in polysaccharide export with SLBB domain